MRTVVIPAAGMGSRLFPMTAAVPKELLPLVDRPALEYVLEEAVRSGVAEAVVVTRPGKRAIRDYLEQDLPGRPWGRMRFRFVHQEVPLGLGHAVLVGAPLAAEHAFAVALPDDIVLGGCLGEMTALAERSGRGVVAVRRVAPAEISKYGVVAATPTGLPRVYDVWDLVEKPLASEAPSDLAVLGRYVLPPEIGEWLRRLEPGRGGELQLTDALRQLAAVRPLLAYEIPGRVLDIGSRAGYLRATVELALAHPEIGPGFADFLGGALAGRGARAGLADVAGR